MPKIRDDAGLERASSSTAWLIREVQREAGHDALQPRVLGRELTQLRSGTPRSAKVFFDVPNVAAERPTCRRTGIQLLAGCADNGRNLPEGAAEHVRAIHLCSAV